MDFFRQRLAQVFPAVELDSVAVHGAESLNSDVSVDFQGTLNASQQGAAVTLTSSWMPHNYLTALAPTGTRIQDLVLPSPWTTEEEIRISLPAGASVKELPRDQEINTSFGSIRLRYTRSAHELVVQSHVEFEKSRINTEEYPAFRQFCALVERSLRNEIVVGLPR